MAKKFEFKKNQTIGAAQAELDERFLRRCFVDTGDADILIDCDDPKRIVVGRTGAGKSALLNRITETEEHVVQIKPEALALGYVTNSSILRFLSEAGVDLDIFFRLLWRHVFVVELIRERFGIDTEDKQMSLFDRLWLHIPSKRKHERALQYLRDRGPTFWQDTEYRVREVTQRVETDLSAALQSSLPSIGSLGASAAKRLSEEQKADIVHKAQEVVNRVQIRELSEIIDFIDEVLMSDTQRRFYIAVDGLDEDWIEDHFRFRLIRALITTSIDLAHIRCAKIIVAIRQDLLDRVFRYTRGPGHQEEKLRSAILTISWNQRQLIEVLDSRIGALVKEQYTTKIATQRDLLPSKVGNEETINYVLDRTLLRPRDVIQFFNQCILYAEGSPNVSLRQLREAEGAYSRDRLRALADEWIGLYPHLLDLAELLKRKDEHFAVRDLSITDLEDNILKVMSAGVSAEGIDASYIKLAWEGDIPLAQYRIELVLIFYKVGLVGLKTDAFLPVSYSYDKGVTVSRAEISGNTRVYVHKTFWRALGVPGRRFEETSD